MVNHQPVAERAEKSSSRVKKAVSDPTGKESKVKPEGIKKKRKNDLMKTDDAVCIGLHLQL